MLRDRVLIIRNSALGDVAMTLPVLYSVAQKYPATDFYLLTRPFFAKIFVNRPANLHIIEADYKTTYKGIKGVTKLIRQLADYRFTAVADLHNVLRSWVIDLYFRIKGTRVAMVDKQRSSRVSPTSRTTNLSFINRYFDVFARLGYKCDADFVSVYQNSEVATPIVIDHPSVGIAPFARYANKAYPITLMEEVVSLLAAEGINIYLYGAKGAEAQTLDSWAEKYSHCTSLAGKMDITSELATMSQMDVMVTMDSANQHLASIVGTPVISIWGATSPGCGFYGYRQNESDAICLGLDCQPCTVAGSKKCRRGTLDCMTKIKPQLIAKRVVSNLNHKK